MKEDIRVIRQGWERGTFNDGHVVYEGVRHFTVVDTGEKFVEPSVKALPLYGTVTYRPDLPYRRNGGVKDITF